MKQGKWNDAPCINFNMQTICEYVEKDVKNEPGKVYEHVCMSVNFWHHITRSIFFSTFVCHMSTKCIHKSPYFTNLF